MKKLSELLTFVTFDWYRNGPTDDMSNQKIIFGLILSMPDCDSLHIGNKVFSNKYY
tara:strand:- start:12 stop:179 length:168 start_codon:yes stop_codon:yes gene_type:complete